MSAMTLKLFPKPMFRYKNCIPVSTNYFLLYDKGYCSPSAPLSRYLQRYDSVPSVLRHSASYDQPENKDEYYDPDTNVLFKKRCRFHSYQPKYSNRHYLTYRNNVPTHTAFEWQSCLICEEDYFCGDHDFSGDRVYPVKFVKDGKAFYKFIKRGPPTEVIVMTSWTLFDSDIPDLYEN